MQSIVFFCNVIDLTAGMSFYVSCSIDIVLGTSVRVNQGGTDHNRCAQRLHAQTY